MDNLPLLLLQTRRHFFRDCAVGIGAVALGSLLHEGRAAPAAIVNPLAPKQPHYTPRAKSVIFLFMAGGPSNPLGARALYLGKTIYRIHGTNQPSTIGQFVSSGCIRLVNEDIVDLYGRVNVGTRVVVLPKPPAAASATPVPR